jgi:hypothetical protein
MKKGLAGKLVGTFIVLIIIVSVSAAFMIITEAKKEGVEYAQDRTTLDCFNEVTRGGRICTKTSCFLENRYFYQSCMDHADESAELCDSLPEIRALLKLEIWKKKQCENLGRKDRGCHHIWLKALVVCGK